MLKSKYLPILLILILTSLVVGAIVIYLFANNNKPQLSKTFPPKTFVKPKSEPVKNDCPPGQSRKAMPTMCMDDPSVVNNTTKLEVNPYTGEKQK